MEKAKITFLGTGGGRFVVLSQLRATGGFILEMDGEMLHIDPGPGALVRAKQYGINLRKLTGILVSHHHPDHYTDAEMSIEAMTNGTTKKRGVLIGNSSVINGSRDEIPAISNYHKKAVERCEVLGAGERARINRIEITTTRTKHSEPGCIGFVFRGSRKIGYTSDGEYYKGQEDCFRGCDCLIINVLRPRGVEFPDHMNSMGARELIARTKPKLAVIDHFGMKMLGKCFADAAWIEKETGVRTVAARDGMVLMLNRKPIISSAGGRAGKAEKDAMRSMKNKENALENKVYAGKKRAKRAI